MGENPAKAVAEKWPEKVENGRKIAGNGQQTQKMAGKCLKMAGKPLYCI